MASRAAAEVATLAVDVQHLAGWCQQVDAAHANHEQRLQLLEEASSAAGAAGGNGAAAEAFGVGGEPRAAGGAVQQQQQQQQLAALEAALGEQEARLRWLEVGAGAAAGSRPATAAGAGPGAAAAAAAPAAVEAQLGAAESRLEGLLREAQSELATQQAQHASSTQELVHSMLTDVMSLARHTKALDGEVRSLRGGVGQLQDALLRSSGAFARALGIPSPLGPFTTFPPS